MKRFLMIIFILCNFSFLYSAKKVEVFTANNIVTLIKERISTIKSFYGVFSYTYNNKKYTGEIKFKHPNKFLMNYYFKPISEGESREPDQILVSDGKLLWLVFKEQNIAICETLERDKSSPLIGWNINRLSRDYVPTLPKAGYRVKYGKIEAYKIDFLPKSSTEGFRIISLIVADNGDILKIDAINQLGISLEMTLKYVNFNVPISDDDFTYEPDENTQIYENILIPKEN